MTINIELDPEKQKQLAGSIVEALFKRPEFSSCEGGIGWETVKYAVIEELRSVNSMNALNAHIAKCRDEIMGRVVRDVLAEEIKRQAKKLAREQSELWRES
jgi:hypothetical protein